MPLAQNTKILALTAAMLLALQGCFDREEGPASTPDKVSGGEKKLVTARASTGKPVTSSTDMRTASRTITDPAKQKIDASAPVNANTVSPSPSELTAEDTKSLALDQSASDLSSGAITGPGSRTSDAARILLETPGFPDFQHESFGEQTVPDPAFPEQSVDEPSSPERDFDMQEGFEQDFVTQGEFEQYITEENFTAQDSIEQDFIAQGEFEPNIAEQDFTVQDSIEQDFIAQGEFDQSTIEQDTIEQDIVEQDIVEQDIVEQDTVEQDTVEQDTVEQDTVELDLRPSGQKTDNANPAAESVPATGEETSTSGNTAQSAALTSGVLNIGGGIRPTGAPDPEKQQADTTSADSSDDGTPVHSKEEPDNTSELATILSACSGTAFGDNLVLNGDFALVSTAPVPVASGTDLGAWVSDLEFIGTNILPAAGEFAIFDGRLKTGTLLQNLFKGDLLNGVPAATHYVLASGANAEDGNQIIWSQQVDGLEIGATYVFYGYFSNLSSDRTIVEPNIGFTINQEALLDVPIPFEEEKDTWHRVEFVFDAGSGTITIEIRGLQANTTADVSMTSLGLQRC